MRHIKIYEEYSDKDLSDLLGDLESIGHKHRLVMGEDFGFGKDMKKPNTGEEVLYLSELAKEKIKESLTKDFGASHFSNRGVIGKPFDGWRGIKGITSGGKYGFTNPIYGRMPATKESIWYWGDPESYPPFLVKLESGHRAFPAKERKESLMGKERVKELYSKIIPYIEGIKF